MLDITKTSSVIKVKLELIRVKRLIDWNSYIWILWYWLD